VGHLANGVVELADPFVLHRRPGERTVKVRREVKRSAADCVLRFFPAASAMAPARRTDLGLLLVVLIWGTNFPVIKIALEPMHPFVVNALRFLFSAVVLAGLAA